MKKKPSKRLAIEYEERLYTRWMRTYRSAYERWPEAEIRNAYIAGYRAAKREKGRKRCRGQ